MAYKMNGFGGFGAPVKQKIKLGPLKPGYLGGNYTEKGKAVNYINKANRFKATYNPKTAGPGNLQSNPYKGRKFSKAARSVGIKKGFGSTLSKFFGRRAFGPISLLSGTLGTGLTTQASNKGRTKMTSKQMKKVNTQLQKATYEGNKKRYK